MAIGQSGVRGRDQADLQCGASGSVMNIARLGTKKIRFHVLRTSVPEVHGRTADVAKRSAAAGNQQNKKEKVKFVSGGSTLSKQSC